MVPEAGACRARAQCLAQLLRVRHLVATTIAKQDEDRTQRFLFAAARGDAATVRSVRARTWWPAQGCGRPGMVGRAGTAGR